MKSFNFFSRVKFTSLNMSLYCKRLPLFRLVNLVAHGTQQHKTRNVPQCGFNIPIIIKCFFTNKKNVLASQTIGIIRNKLISKLMSFKSGNTGRYLGDILLWQRYKLCPVQQTWQPCSSPKQQQVAPKSLVFLNTFVFLIVKIMLYCTGPVSCSKSAQV